MMRRGSVECARGVMPTEWRAPSDAAKAMANLSHTRGRKSIGSGPLPDYAGAEVYLSALAMSATCPGRLGRYDPVVAGSSHIRSVTIRGHRDLAVTSP
jgi:hypothetical protein